MSVRSMATAASTGVVPSYDLVKELIDSRTQLSLMIAKCGGYDKEKGIGRPYLCPVDRKSIPLTIEQIYTPEAIGKTTETDREDKKEEVKDIKNVKSKILSHITHERFNKSRFIRNKVKIPIKIKISKGHKSCPSLAAAQNTVSEIIPYLTISHKEGYNFVNEYVYVYKGTFSRENAYENFLHVCKRAIIAVDPLMDETMADDYGQYLLRRGMWEIDLGFDLVHGSMKDIFKTFDENIKISRRYNVNIYLSKSDDDINVWYRICYDSDEVNMKKKNPNPALAGASFAYYRRYVLTRSHVESFLRDIDSERPPPPPRAGNDSDYQLYLLWTFGRTDVFNLDDDVELDFDDNIVNVNPEEIPDNQSRTAISDVPSKYGSSKKEPLSVTSSRKSSTKPLSLLHDCVPGNEIHSWGLESAPVSSILDAISSSSNLVSSSRVISLPMSFALDKVTSIACSARHVVILTNLGLVYTMGENSEGALGLGDTYSRGALTLISSWPISVKIAKVAANTSDLGSHSCAIDSEGMLYAWGLSHATGLGKTASTLSPTLVDTFPKPRGIAVADGNEPVGEEDNLTTQPLKIKDVSCGNAFTVVVAVTGEVFSWGMWSHGRLGLGKIPMVASKRGGGFFNKGPSKLARYQLRPIRVDAIKEAGAAVSCGDSHCLLLTVSGKVWAWGSNTSGQVGVGMKSSGILEDIITPKLLLFNNDVQSNSANSGVMDDISINNHSIYSETSNFADAVESAEIKMVKAGATHSLAVDSSGKVWSWGGKGGACLGRGIPAPPEAWAGRLSTLFASSFNSGVMVIPYELTSWIRSWTVPSVITTLNEVSKIVEISTGDSHTIFRTTLGELYICGEGPVVPPVITSTDDDMGDTMNVDDLILSDKFSVKRPLQPSSKWLPDLFGRRVSLLGGSAMRCYAVMSNESIADTFTGHLLENIMYKGSGGVNRGNQSSLASVSSITSFGRPDCVVIAGGGMFPAHRAVLACRSTELRDQILIESPTDSIYLDIDEIDMNMIQIILPELNYDAAKALMYYLYTDDIPYSNSAQLATLTSLLRASKSLKLPRLQIIVEQYTAIVKAITTSGKNTDDGGDDEVKRSRQINLSTQLLPEPPPRMLTKDFATLIGDPQFADVRFVAEGKPMYAHRLFLMERCTYFEAMFGSRIMESQNGTSTAVIDVVVPDSYKSFLRLLFYIYTHAIPPGDTETLLNDVLMADRYHLFDMRTLLENMIMPDELTWPDILEVSRMIRSDVLSSRATDYLRDNSQILLEAIGDEDDDREDEELEGEDNEDGSTKVSQKVETGLQVIRQYFPEVLDEILKSRRLVQVALPSDMLLDYIDPERPGAKNPRKAENYAQSVWVPIVWLAVLVVTMYFYAKVASIFSLGNLVPLINSVFVLAVGYMAYRKIFT